MSLLRSALTPFARNARSFVTSPAARDIKDPVHPGYKKLQEKAKRFNIEDGRPVFIKGGVVDSVLYKITMGLCVGAVIWDFILYYDLSQKVTTRTVEKEAKQVQSFF